jgi:hypothetical protein
VGAGWREENAPEQNLERPPDAIGSGNVLEFEDRTFGRGVAYVRIAMTVLAASLTLAGCATRPQVAHEGVLPAPLGTVAVQAGLATPVDAALVQAIEARVMAGLAEKGAVAAGAARPDYLVQVSVATSDPAVGVSTAVGPLTADAPWRSAPTRLQFWNRRTPVHTATLVLIEIATGRPTAWATVRSPSADAKDLADRLLVAVSATPKV